MKNKQVFYWVLDLLILLAYLVEYSIKITGYDWHELLGLAVGAMLLVHLATHWKWVVSVTKRLVASLQGKAVLCYTIDFVLLALFAGIILTGLLISSLLNLPLTSYEFWRFLHVSISYLTLVVVGLKIAIHWSWIVNTTKRKIFNRRQDLLPQVEGEPSCQSQALLNRRQFLQESGIFTGVILFSGLGYVNWITKNLLSEPEKTTATNVQADAVTVQSTATAFQPLPTEASTTAADMGIEQSVLEVQLDATATAVPTAMPTSVPTVQAVVPVSVRCNRGCSYPGRCRRYTDSNNNNRCDLSEW